jgi:hypothetical protein
MSAIKRRARDKDGNAIEPMTLGNMRSHGIERVEVSCTRPDCGYAKSHRRIDLAGRLPGSGYRSALPLPSLRRA